MSKLSEFGRPIESSLVPIERTPETEHLFGWQLSEEAKADIREIENNARHAPRNTAHIILD